MKTFQKILCPVDFSENSAKALQWADYLNKRYGSEVVVLHVMLPYPAGAPGGFDYESYQASVVTRVQEFLAPVKDRFAHVLSTGDAAQKIIALSKGLGATSILMGTRGLSGAAHAFMGSTTETVMRSSEIPVVTISPACKPPVQEEEHRVLLPVHSLQNPPSGYVRFRKVLRELEASVTLLHVVELDDPIFDSNFHANPFLVTTHQELEKKQEVLKIGGQIMRNDETTEAIIKFGTASEEILSEAEAGNFAFILMGARKRTFLSRFVESTSYQVTCKSMIPVITIRIK